MVQQKTITTATGGTAEEEHENMLKWLGEHQNLSVSVSVFVPVRRYGIKEKRLNELFAYPSTPLRLPNGYVKFSFYKIQWPSGIFFLSLKSLKFLHKLSLCLDLTVYIICCFRYFTVRFFLYLHNFLSVSVSSCLLTLYLNWLLSGLTYVELFSTI